MSDSYHSFIVVLESDIREDDAEATINAIMQIKGVTRVIANISDGTELLVAETRVKREIYRKIIDILGY